MPRFNREWTVHPHGAVRTIDEGILTVEGEIPMPLGNFPRRMTIVGLSGNRSAIFSAIALEEGDMHRIEELGEPSFLIVPNGHHRLDAHAWKERYPDLKVICPPGAEDDVGDVTSVDSTKDILDDRDVDFVIVKGTGKAEAALIVRRKNGTTLVTNDVIANVRHPRGLGAKIMARLAGFGVKRPRVPRVVKRLMVRDRVELARQLFDWTDLPRLRRVIPSHGDIIEQPVPVLRKMAEEL